MANYTQKIQPHVLQYNADTMMYSIEGRFVETTGATVAGILSERGVGEWGSTNWSLPHANLPLTYDVIHRGTTIFGRMFAQPVTCYPAGRRVDRTTSGAATEVIVSMLGRAHGTHNISTRVQMTSEVIYQSLNFVGAETTYRPLGVDFQGVPRDVPMVVYSVSQNLGMFELSDVIANANLIAGSVNEDAWLPPWNGDIADPPIDPGLYYNRGEVLYLGPVRTEINRPSRTALVTHEFARLQSRERQDVYRWFGYTQVVNTVTGLLDREYDAVASGGSIQKIAGTDLWWDDATPIPEFDTLNLGPEHF